MGKHRRKKKTWHHLNPKSRAPELLVGIEKPSKEFIEKIYKKKLIDDCKQVGWHALFSNMFVWEAIDQIKLWANENLDGFKIALNFKQWHAWRAVFGADATPKEAIEVIKRDWWPEYPAEADFERLLLERKRK